MENKVHKYYGVLFDKKNDNVFFKTKEYDKEEDLLDWLNYKVSELNNTRFVIYKRTYEVTLVEDKVFRRCVKRNESDN